MLGFDIQRNPTMRYYQDTSNREWIAQPSDACMPVTVGVQLAKPFVFDEQIN